MINRMRSLPEGFPEKFNDMLSYPVLAYSLARGASYTIEYQLLNAASYLLPGARKHLPRLSPKTELAIRSAGIALLKRDSENILNGIYPVSVLSPESPVSHFLRLPKIFLDGLSIYHRRIRGKTAEFDDEAKEYLDELPRYYRRNFHFQTGGYLSARSAELYEHQVEMLFGGMADAMRRMIIKPLRESLVARGLSPDGKGLTFLEIGAGTGRATRFVHLAFPRAKIVATDLSDPYLKQARKNLSECNRIDFLQADGGKLPFQAGEFDAVYSVFLYHELPLKARQEVISESLRVLKKEGFLGLVDSLQNGDQKDFDGLLADFPMHYHEPFYRNYAETPMKKLLEEAGAQDIRSDMGFFSKVCWSHS